jgi:hypothetical protein
MEGMQAACGSVSLTPYCLMLSTLANNANDNLRVQRDKQKYKCYLVKNGRACRQEVAKQIGGGQIGVLFP